MADTIHFSDSEQLDRHKWYGKLILLLYLAVQFDLHTFTNWNRSCLQHSQNE